MMKHFMGHKTVWWIVRVIEIMAKPVPEVKRNSRSTLPDCITTRADFLSGKNPCDIYLGEKTTS